VIAFDKHHDQEGSSASLRAAEEFRLLHFSTPNAPQSAPSSATPDATIDEIQRLYAALDSVCPDANPRTAQLLDGGRRKMGQKLIEEASEVAFEGLRDRARGVIRESADLIYHLVVLWRECGVAPDEVWSAMRHRANTLGIAEKLPKRPKVQV
jgi:phosphoribosyl-ATP pyrophosphohydrolase